MRRSLQALVLSALVCLMASTVDARLFGVNHRYQLHLNHDKGTIYICDLCATVQRRILWSTEIAPTANFEIGSGDEIEVWIDEPNPILFRYEFDNRQVTKNADAEAAEKMTDSLGNLVKIFGPTTGGNQSQEITLSRERAVQPARQKLEAQGITTKFLDDLAEKVQKLADHQQHVKEHIALSAKQSFGNTANEMNRNWPLIRAHVLGTESVQVFAGDVSAWDLQALLKGISDDYGKLNAAALGIRDLPGGTPDEYMAKLQNAILIAPAVTQLVKQMSQFSANSAALGVPARVSDKDGKPILIVYDPVQDQTYNFKIRYATPDEGLSDDAKAAAQKADSRGERFTGTFGLMAKPAHPVHLTYGAAGVYSLVKRPSFGVDKSGTDLVITRKSSDRVSGQTVAAMLTLIPDRWSDPFFAWGFQFGFTPVKDNLAFYVGTGPILSKYFSLGFGLTVQQVDKLAPGLHVGQVVNASSDLKTSKEYKSGGYFHITINLKK